MSTDRQDPGKAGASTVSQIISAQAAAGMSADRIAEHHQDVAASLLCGAETPDPKGGIKSIKITLPPGYDDACTPVAERRLAQAGYHLAELLNAIHWAD